MNEESDKTRLRQGSGEQRKTSDRAYYMFAMRIVGDFGIAIAVPAVLGVLLGNWLDNKFDKYPLFLIICLVLAFAATVRIIQKKAKRYGDQYNKLN
ncbi:MAG: AtpZ/AtpI family protein [Candidatus Magasanikbacteria bacterium]